MIFKKNLFDSVFFVLIFSIITYVFINSDYRIIHYDSEPDYLANGLLILKNGFPLNAHHPGTFTYYFISILLFLTTLFKLSLHNTIILIRITFFLIGLIIYLWYNKISRLKIILCYSLFLIIPGFKQVLNVFTAELLLIPCSFIIIEILKSNNINIYFLSLFYGLMLNIKIASLILLPIIILSILNKNNFNWKLIYKVLGVTFLTYVMLILPVFNGFFIAIKGVIFNMVPFWEEIYSFIKFNTFSRVSKYLFYVSVLLIITVFFFLITKSNFINNLLKKINDTLYIKIISFFIFTFLILDFESDFLRHFIILIPFGIDKINFDFKYKKQTNFVAYISILILFLANVRKPIEYNKTLKSDEIINSSFSRVFLYQSSILNSEISFLEWAKYRYSQSIDIIPKIWYENHKIYTNGSVEYLNTRNFKNNDLVIRYNLKPSDDSSLNYDKCFHEQVYYLSNNNSKLIIFKKDDFIFKNDIKKISENLNSNLELIMVSDFDYFKIYNLKIKSHNSLNPNLCN
tara:strand:+ start:948 stop:2495 length:1548 start_codon:yes stop_codon:yes gene_type:complete